MSRTEHVEATWPGRTHLGQQAREPAWGLGWGWQRSLKELGREAGKAAQREGGRDTGKRMNNHIYYELFPDEARNSI